jgi:hypothetical protein
METKLTREQLVDKCATQLLTSIVNGNLKTAVSDIIDNVIEWNNNTPLSEKQVLLTEVTPTPIVPEKSSAISNEPTIRPAAVGNITSTNDQNSGQRSAQVGSKVSSGWSDPFQGTSWGIKR